MTEKRLTLKTVAQLLNVSTATISNAFNRPDQLSEKRREEILSACEKLGYFGPNKAAQSLRKGKTNIIALILADSLEYTVSDPVASEFIRGVSKKLSEHNKHLLMFSGASESVNDIIDFVDGFICYGAPKSNSLLQQLHHIQKPMVSCDFTIEGKPSVNLDNAQACYELTKQVVRAGDNVAILGLRILDSEIPCRIHDIPLSYDSKHVTHDRLNGYFKAFSEIGYQFDRSLLWHIPESSEKMSRSAAKEVLSVYPRPNLILCMSDLIAMTLLQEALKMGIKVPEEIRITGFDGIPETERSHPRVTTVQQHSMSKGVRTAEMLLEDIQDNESFVYQVCIRESA